MGYNPNNPNMGGNYNPNMGGNYNPNNPNMGYNPNIPMNNNLGSPGMNMGPAEFYQIGKNVNAIFEKTNYMDALQKATTAYVKQKMELLEIITGCETKNRYQVFLKYPDGTYVYIFKAKENSGWCSRNCLA